MIPLGRDFYYYWAAARAAREGTNIYAPEKFMQLATAAGWPSLAVDRYGGVPWGLWIFYPFGALDYGSAWRMWMLTLALATFSLIWWSVNDPKIYGLHSLRLPNWLKWHAAICFPPALSTWIWGNQNISLFAGVLIFLRFFNERRFLGGMGLSLTAWKPHFFIPLYLAVVVRDLKQGNIQTLLGFGFGLVVQALTSEFLYPGSFKYFMELLGSGSMTQFEFYGASLVQNLSVVLDSNAVRLFGALIASLGAVTLALKFPLSRGHVIGIILPICALFAPYAYSHTFLALFPSFVMSLAIIYPASGSSLRRWLIFTALIGAIVAGSPTDFDWIMTISPLILLALLWKRSIATGAYESITGTLSLRK